MMGDNDNAPVSYVRNKQPNNDAPAPPNWAEQVVTELEAMGIEVLKVTDANFGARLGRKREDTQQERIGELLTAFGMVAYAISQGRLMELGYALGDHIGRWIHKDANVPALALEAAYGYPPPLASARGKIVVLAVREKMAAKGLVQYVHGCGGLDKAVDHARHTLRNSGDSGKSSDAGMEAPPATAMEASTTATASPDQVAPSTENSSGDTPAIDSAEATKANEASSAEVQGNNPDAQPTSKNAKRRRRKKWRGLPGDENHRLALVSRDTDWENLDVEFVAPRRALGIARKALEFKPTPAPSRVKTSRPRGSAIPPKLLAALYEIMRRRTTHRQAT